ncbi:MAG: L,D-transpeptidase [Planctomycetota bacterium]
MKGIVVVALGAILIWFGLSTGGGRTEASGPPAADVDDGYRFEVEEDPAGSYAYPEQETASGAPWGEAHDDPSLAEGGEYWAQPDVSEHDSIAAREGTPNGEFEAPTPAPADRQPIDPPPVSFTAPTDAPARFDEEPSIGRMSAVDPTRLATLLLEAWIARDSSDLLLYLTEGEGSELPPAQQQIVAAYWEALVGRVEAANERLPTIRAGNVTSAQLALLSAALDPPGRRAVPHNASSSRVEPIGHAMEMILLEDEARSLLDARDYGRSAMAWSDLIQLEVRAPWAPHRAALLAWGKELGKAQNNHRFSPRGQWPAEEIKVQSGDSLTTIRKRFLRQRPDLVICTGLIGQANGVQKYVHPGDVLRIPTERVNVIVDLDARVVLYRHGDEVVQLWECGVGKPGSETPLGVYSVGDKIKKPAHTTWKLPYGHPDNPLGSRWLALLQDGRNTSYGFHGTSDPSGVGKAVSAGCVRMRNEDVNELFEILPMGAEVVIQE